MSGHVPWPYLADWRSWQDLVVCERIYDRKPERQKKAGRRAVTIQVQNKCETRTSITNFDRFLNNKFVTMLYFFHLFRRCILPCYGPEGNLRVLQKLKYTTKQQHFILHNVPYPATFSVINYQEQSLKKVSNNSCEHALLWCSNKSLATREHPTQNRSRAFIFMVFVLAGCRCYLQSAIASAFWR